MLVDHTKQKYQELGGLFFPVLQQDGVTRIETPIKCNDISDVAFLNWLREHDR